jgi:hypothetical protein
VFGISGLFLRGQPGGRFARAAGASLVTGLVAVLLSASMAAASVAGRHRPATTVIRELHAVSCASTKSCMAVGDGNNIASGILTEKWNGTKWSVASAPIPSGSTAGQLRGVACTAAKSCIAVGSYYASGTTLPLAEMWNGKKWSLLAAAAPSGATDAYLESVSCASAKNCQAVGASGDDTLAEGWNGSKWAIETSPSPNPAKPNVLTGIACPATSECWAVGSFFPTDYNGSLTEKWNGSKWSVVTTPTSKSGELIGDACSGRTDCVSAGISDKLFAIGQVWNGSKWATATPAKPTGATDSELNGVSCPAGSACEAGGDYDNGSVSAPLAEGWTGTKWAVQATPSISGSTYASFQGMACTTASNCWAVGETITSSGTTSPLIERWNGTSWTVSAS